MIDTKFFKTGIFSVILSVATLNVAMAGWEEGVAAFKAKKYQLAVIEFKTVIKKNPRNVCAHYGLGLSYKFLKNNSKSKFHMKKANALDPAMALDPAIALDPAAVLKKICRK